MCSERRRIAYHLSYHNNLVFIAQSNTNLCQLAVNHPDIWTSASVLHGRALPSCMAPSQTNLLLSVLASELDGAVSTVELRVGDLLSIGGSNPSHAYFPAGALISLVGQSRDGHRIELAIVGNEGMAGMVPIISDIRPNWDLDVQVRGSANRVAFPALQRLFDNSAKARCVLLAYWAYLMAQTGQSCICHASHPAETRLARWLLTIRDRLQQDSLPLTHESLSDMVGVRRPTLSTIAGKLQKSGLITLSRTRIQINDHEALTRFACECHQLTKRYLERYITLVRRTDRSLVMKI